MAWHTLSSEARNARILAQRLYGQCRKSASVWRALTPSLRKIRNGLEELEDLINDEKLVHTTTSQVVEALRACNVSLRDLDRHLQFYRCSAARWQAAISRTIAEVDAALVVAAASIAAVLDSLPVESDQEPQPAPESPGDANHNHDSNDPAWHLQTAEPIPPRNDALPEEPNPAEIPLPLSPLLEPSDEDTFDETSTRPWKEQPMSFSSTSTHSQKILLPWRSPFAEVDPLSIDFEAATSILLGLQPEAVTTQHGILEDNDLDSGTQSSSEERDVLRTENDSSIEVLDAPVDESSHNVAPIGRAPTTAHSRQASADALARESLSSSTTQSQDGFELSMAGNGFGGELTECSDEEPARAVASPGLSLGASEEPVDVVEEAPSETDAAETPFVDCLSINSTSDRESISRAEHAWSDHDSAVIVEASAQSLVVDAKQASPGLYSGTSDGQDAAHDEKADPAVLESFRPLLAPTSKHAAHEDTTLSTQREIQPGRSDSKVDIHEAALSSPATASRSADDTGESSATFEASQVTQPTDHSPAEGSKSPNSPRHSSLSLTSQSSGPSNTGEDISLSRLTLTEDLFPSDAGLVSPLTLSPKARYRIVNLGPDDDSSCLGMPGSIQELRSVSPVSVALSGEIPVIFIDGCQENSNGTGDELRKDALPADEQTLSVTERLDEDISTFSADFLYGQDASSGKNKVHQTALLQRYNGQSTSTQPATNADAISVNDDCGNAKEQYSLKETDETSGVFDLDKIRIQSLCMSWHRQDWQLAEAYLLGLMEARQEDKDRDLRRRVRHLLGVCASLQGQWQRAITYFLSALRTPLSLTSELDDGDAAALVWLTDCYILSNRRLDAFVANTLTLRRFEQHSVEDPTLRRVIQEEQKALLIGTTIAALEQRWTQSDSPKTDSLVNPHLAAPALIELCFHQPCAGNTALPAANPTEAQNRASLLQAMDLSDAALAESIEFQVTPESFVPGTGWPMPFDPFFNTQQAARGRICDSPTDILETIRTKPSLKIPKTSPLNASRFDCFTCGDLEWLVSAVRDCLVFLEMKWDEVVGSNTICYTARFAMRYRNVFTANYFTISIFRQSMRHSYGIEVCADGVRSARVLSDAVDYPMGVHFSCEKRLKKFFKDYLTRAHKLWVKDGKPAPPSSVVLADA